VNIADPDQIWGFVHTLEEDPVTPNLLFMGTEFGLYVSVNGGEDWLPWRQGVPPAPVRSLVIHPRDHDLVIGTHGRALYVLDDIRPLRAIAEDPGLLSSEIHLFDPPPAYLRSVAQVDGYHFAADAMFQGETRPPGALLTYVVADGEEEAVQIEIMDAEGEVIRHMDGPARPGLNRVSWNLREDAPPQPAESARGGGRFRGMGPEVLPGRFSVRVRHGDAEVSQDLEVLPDPRIEIPMAVRLEKQEAVRRGLSLTATMQEVQAGNSELTQALVKVGELLGDDRDEYPEIRTLVDSIRGELGEIGSEMGGLNEFRRAVFSLGSSRDAPTEAEMKGLTRMEEGLDGVVARFNQLVEGLLPELRQALQAARFDPLPQVEPIRGG
jgi:hypothetical protein